MEDLERTDGRTGKPTLELINRSVSSQSAYANRYTGTFYSRIHVYAFNFQRFASRVSRPVFVYRN
jgi:hypothetical protein